MPANKDSISPTISRFAPSGYFLLDRNGAICELNHSGARLLCEERTAILSNNFRKYISPASLPAFDQFLERIFNHSPESVCELELKPNDRSNLNVMFEGFVTENQERLVINAIDITEQKNAETALQKKEEKYRMLLDLAPDAFFQGDTNGKFITVNGNAALLTGYSRDELLTMNMSDLFDTETLKNSPLRYDLLKQGEALKTERIIKRKNGELLHVEMNSRAMPDNTYQCFMRDITLRKRAEELLKINEERFRQLIENSFDMIVLLDINGFQTYVSDSCQKILGYRPDELINIPVIDQMIHPDDKEYLITEFRSAIERGYGGVQYRHRHKNGGWVYLEAYGTNQLNNPAIHALVLNVRDITERKLAEDALKEKEVTLRELNATKDKFFSIIAHDLKSPFHSIIGYSNLALKQIQEKNYAEIEKYASVIQKSAQQTMNLLLNLLDWSRAQTGMLEFNPETIEPEKLIDELMPIFKGAAQQKTISISRNIAKNDAIIADKAMVNTILRNLISNAIKFTHPGGKILISVSQNNRQTIFTVSDNGVGIPETAFTKLFRIDQNYSTRGTQDEKGTGLGLIICKTFVKKHGGKLWFENNTDQHPFNQGSSFYFSIPEKE